MRISCRRRGSLSLSRGGDQSLSNISCGGHRRWRRRQRCRNRRKGQKDSVGQARRGAGTRTNGHVRRTLKEAAALDEAVARADGRVKLDTDGGNSRWRQLANEADDARHAYRWRLFKSG
jgi:hypothetical protein